jgi:hypothetical protein
MGGGKGEGERGEGGRQPVQHPDANTSRSKAAHRPGGEKGARDKKRMQRDTPGNRPRDKRPRNVGFTTSARDPAIYPTSTAPAPMQVKPSRAMFYTMCVTVKTDLMNS